MKKIILCLLAFFTHPSFGADLASLNEYKKGDMIFPTELIKITIKNGTDRWLLFSAYSFIPKDSQVLGGNDLIVIQEKKQCGYCGILAKRKANLPDIKIAANTSFSCTIKIKDFYTCNEKEKVSFDIRDREAIEKRGFTIATELCVPTHPLTELTPHNQPVGTTPPTPPPTDKPAS